MDAPGYRSGCGKTLQGAVAPADNDRWNPSRPRAWGGVKLEAAVLDALGWGMVGIALAAFACLCVALVVDVEL